MRAVKPGCSGTVEPNSSMIAGPTTTVPGDRSGRQSTGVSTYPSPASKQTCLTVVEVRAERASKPPSGVFLISGRWIGPMPETRRLTHSTCWVGSPEKS